MRALIVAALFAGAAPVPCVAQDPEEVARPDVKVGDRWVYRRLNYNTGAVTEILEMRVTFADAKAIHVVIKLPMQRRESDSIATPEWNTVASGRGIWKPHAGYFKFPLRVGDTYAAEYELSQPQEGRNAVVLRRHHARVVGWEEVTVPAGTFRALKIELVGTYDRQDRIDKGSTKEMLWYVPQVKRTVKYMYDGGPYDRRGDELVEFRVQ